MPQKGDEKLACEPDNYLTQKPEIVFANLAGPELIEHWRAGCREAATVLMERYRLRLVALIASRFHKRLRGSIDPEDVVQSAMGSFFRTVRSSSKSRMEIDSTVSVWNLLAMFARRKLSRSLERATALKRGGGLEKTVWDQIESDDSLQHSPGAQEAEELLAELKSSLAPEQVKLIDHLIAGNTQKEIAQLLNVDERTVRRRVTSLRSLLAPALLENHSQKASTRKIDQATQPLLSRIALPRIHYHQFILEKMIGSGGFGKVYRARMRTDGARVAIKFLRRHFWSDVRIKHALLHEIDHASRIHHAGILRYLGWGESPHGGPYIISELIDGSSLAQQMHADDDQWVRWLRQVCRAVEAAHRAGVVHGDLTPNNILLDSNERIVITDFGFATSLRPRETIDDSMQPGLGGTLGFAAPEQLSTAFGQVGSETDIYTIGGIAYYALTGRAPHDQGRTIDSIADTLSEDQLPPTNRLTQTGATAKLTRIATLALRKAIVERPTDVTELISLLSE